MKGKLLSNPLIFILSLHKTNNILIFKPFYNLVCLKTIDRFVIFIF
ncbi:MAG: hypothetical protein BAJALOKI3v1_720022, partial [Promethearchaeota archaeon]